MLALMFTVKLCVSPFATLNVEKRHPTLFINIVGIVGIINTIIFLFLTNFIGLLSSILLLSLIRNFYQSLMDSIAANFRKTENVGIARIDFGKVRFSGSIANAVGEIFLLITLNYLDRDLMTIQYHPLSPQRFGASVI